MINETDRRKSGLEKSTGHKMKSEVTIKDSANFLNFNNQFLYHEFKDPNLKKLGFTLLIIRVEPARAQLLGSSRRHVLPSQVQTPNKLINE